MLHDRAFQSRSDEWLIKEQEELIAYLTKGQGGKFDDTISDLLEIERELTLRETN